MGRQLRPLSENAYYHVFNRGLNKAAIFLLDRDRIRFLELLDELSLKHQVRVLAYCLMSNHYHLFLETRLPNLDKFMHQLQRRYSLFFNSEVGRLGPLFGGRYQCRLVDIDKYGLTLIRYIHLNPEEIGAGHDSYEWSSYQKFLRNGKAPGGVDIAWGLSLFGDGAEAKRRFVEFHRVDNRCLAPELRLS